MDISIILTQLWEAAQLIFYRSIEILEQPLQNTEMLWILLPLLATLLLIELYFGRYREESLGWNSAVGNSLVLFFVAVNLFSYLYRTQLLFSVSFIPQEMFSIALEKSLITFFILLESILLIVLNFFHLMPKNLAFGVSSALTVNFIGVMAVVLVYSSVTVDIITLCAILLLFIVLVLFFRIFYIFIPKVYGSGEEEEKEPEVPILKTTPASPVMAGPVPKGPKMIKKTKKK